MLNEIFEEGESDGEGSGGSSRAASTSGNNIGGAVASPVVMRRHRLVRSRTASCSSSDASDDDQEARKRRQQRALTRHLSKDVQDEQADSNEFSQVVACEIAEEQETIDIIVEEVCEQPSHAQPSTDCNGGLQVQTSTRGNRPLSAACDDERKNGALKEDNGSTENMLDIDTTLRESRSLNCIVMATGDQEGDFPCCSVSEASLLDQCAGSNITVSTDNVTTIYIENGPCADVANERRPSQSGSLGGDRVVIRVTDDGQNQDSAQESMKKAVEGKPNSLKETGSPQEIGASDVVVGLVDSPRLGRTAGARPVSDSQVITRPPQSPSIIKSMSHVEPLSGCGDRPSSKFSLRTSATNGSLAAGRNHYVMDINQNAGGRKNRSEKSNGALAIQGTSKCCSLS